jgi:transposase
MAHRRTLQPRSQPARPPPWAAVNLHAAGIDVGAEAHDVAVPPSDEPQPVRRVGASTVDFESVADWLAAGGITTVALESTGVSGIPRCERLERRGFEVLRVEPPQVQQSKGRPKRAVHDGHWRPRRHPVGRRAGACRPPDHVCVRRRDRRPRAR